MTPLQEARAGLAEVQQRVENLRAKVKEAEAESIPPLKRLEALRARLHKQPLVALVAGRYQLMTWAGVSVATWDMRSSLGALANKKRADILDAIDNGGVNLTVGSGGVTYKAKGLSPRLRTPDAAAIKAWRKAFAASARADEKARDAQAKEDAALKRVYDTGSPIDRSILVGHVADLALAQLASDAKRRDFNAERELERLLADNEWSELRAARLHFEHRKAGTVTDESCRTCKQQAEEAARAASKAAAAKAETERIRALPRKRWTCPTHSNRLAFFERRPGETKVKEDDATEVIVASCPVLYCPVDLTMFLDRAQYDMDKVKAAKKSAKEADAPITVLRFVCPSCSDVQEDSPSEDPETGVNVVYCESCETEWPADSVKVIKESKETRAA